MHLRSTKVTKGGGLERINSATCIFPTFFQETMGNPAWFLKQRKNFLSMFTTRFKMPKLHQGIKMGASTAVFGTLFQFHTKLWILEHDSWNRGRISYRCYNTFQNARTAPRNRNTELQIQLFNFISISHETMDTRTWFLKQRKNFLSMLQHVSKCQNCTKEP